MKTYTVREIREYTGLSRKQLFDYEASIPPIDRVDNAGEKHRGYKLYDKAGLEKLCLAALFSELGAGPQRINDVFRFAEYDKAKVIDELILEAKKERERLNDIILVAGVLRDYDLSELPCNPFQVSDIHYTADALRKYLKSEDGKKLMNIDKKSEKKLMDILGKFGLLDENDVEADKSEGIVEELASFIKNDLNVDNYARVLTSIATMSVSNEEYIAYLDKKIRQGAGEVIGKCIFNYQSERFLAEGEILFDEIDDYYSMDFEDETIKRSVDEFLILLKKWYGYENIEEASNLMQIIRFTIEQDEDADDETKKFIKYFNSVLNYYAEK